MTPIRSLRAILRFLKTGHLILMCSSMLRKQLESGCLIIPHRRETAKERVTECAVFELTFFHVNPVQGNDAFAVGEIDQRKAVAVWDQ